MATTIRNEDAPAYGNASTVLMAQDNDVVQKALKLIERTLQKKGDAFSSPQLVKDYCVLRLATQQREVFSLLLLDNRHRLIAYEELFYGTINAAAVYPREVVKCVLGHNAAAAIMVHNHPSHDPTQSEADVALTLRIRHSLEVIDVRLLDHIIVGGMQTVSLAEKGII